MAGSLNRVQLLGTLGKDPEVRTTQNGNKIANLTVATSETWKDRQSGERKERTEWHRIVIFGDGLTGVAEQYLRKGSQAYFEGKLQTRKWTDQSGQDRYSTEVVISGGDDKLILVGGRPSGSSEERGARRVGRNGSAAPHEAGPQRDDSDLRDEIPF